MFGTQASSFFLYWKQKLNKWRNKLTHLFYFYETKIKLNKMKEKSV